MQEDIEVDVSASAYVCRLSRTEIQIYLGGMGSGAHL